MVDSTVSATGQPLLAELLRIVAAHRGAFRQERTFARAVALLLGWLCAFGRHTITQVLLALGLGASDPTAFYRLFSRRRVDYAALTAGLVGQTVPHSAATEP